MLTILTMLMLTMLMLTMLMLTMLMLIKIMLLMLMLTTLMQGYVKKVKSPKVGGAAMGSKTGTGSAMKCIEVDESWVDMYVNTIIFFNDCDLCQTIGSGIQKKTYHSSFFN